MSVYSGIVQEGKKLGTALGFPTANIELDDSGLSGVFAGTVRFEGKEYDAAIFADTERKLLEAYLLDFSGDLYGKEIAITVHTKLRDAKNFDSREALISAIKEDVKKVRDALA